MAAVAPIIMMSLLAAPALSSMLASVRAFWGSSLCSAPATTAPVISRAASFVGSTMTIAKADVSSRSLVSWAFAFVASNFASIAFLSLPGF